MTSELEVMWVRLAVLGKGCEFSMTSEIAAPSGQEPGRYWRILIRPKKRGVTPVEVFDKSARAAFEDALARAEALGWPGSLGLSDDGPTLEASDARRECSGDEP